MQQCRTPRLQSKKFGCVNLHEVFQSFPAAYHGEGIYYQRKQNNNRKCDCEVGDLELKILPQKVFNMKQKEKRLTLARI